MVKPPSTGTTLTEFWTLPHNDSELAYHLLEVDRWIRYNAYADGFDRGSHVHVRTLRDYSRDLAGANNGGQSIRT